MTALRWNEPFFEEKDKKIVDKERLKRYNLGNRIIEDTASEGVICAKQALRNGSVKTANSFVRKRFKK